MLLLTIGHSTRPARDFIDTLKAHQVESLVDVRTVPRSRRNPQFNREELEAALAGEGLAYLHMPGLGGLRKPRADSINTAWQNDSFRGFADYMQTEEFDRNLTALLGIAQVRRTAIMCAEALPWRCHRSLIADALIARGVDVEHVFSATDRKPHGVTPFARIEGSRVSYPRDF